MFKGFEKISKAIDKVFESIEELEDSIIDSYGVTIVNGNVNITGKIKSLKINGYTIKVPGHVLLGKKNED